MKIQAFNNGFLIRLDRGEDVTVTLQGFLRDNKLKAGTVTGLGAIEETELGYYDLPTKTYLRKTIPGIVELIQYAGNITLLDGRPFIHAHAAVSGPDFQPKSGHFFSGKIAVTGEFVIHPADWNVKRKPDDYTGLNLMDL